MLESGESDSSPWRLLPRPSRLWVPLSMSWPYAARGVPEPGTLIAAAAPLAEPATDAGFTPLSPVPGRVIGTDHVRLTNGVDALAVILETDADAKMPSPSRLDSAQAGSEPITAMLAGMQPGDIRPWINTLGHHGVWIDRWTSPDLLDQLNGCALAAADTIVCNILDADPSLPVNRTAARMHAVEIVAALAALTKLNQAPRLWVIVDRNLPGNEWSEIRRIAASVARNLRIVPVENHYPQPDPSLMLFSLTNRRMKPSMLPTQRGVLLLDAAAAATIGRVFLHDEPMLGVPLAVFDQVRARSHLLYVPVGTRVGDVLAALDMARQAWDLRAGSPLREMRLNHDCIIAGGETGIYAVPREPDINPRPCIRCGWCIEGCPVRINPAGLLEAAQEDDMALARHFGLDSCIECGVCSYVCPSQLPLLGGIRALRGEQAFINEQDVSSSSPDPASPLLQSGPCEPRP